jgi:hypothetical protein
MRPNIYAELMSMVWLYPVRWDWRAIPLLNEEIARSVAI